MDKLNDLSLRISDTLARLSDIERKPAKRWESIVDKVLMVIVGAIVGAILVKMGLPS